MQCIDSLLWNGFAKKLRCIPSRTITQHKIPSPSRFISRGITLNTSYENRKASVRFTVRRNWEQSGSNVYPNFQNSLAEQILVYKTMAILKSMKALSVCKKNSRNRTQTLYYPRALIFLHIPRRIKRQPDKADLEMRCSMILIRPHTSMR